MGQITLRIGEKFGWCPSICRKTKFSERRNRLHHFRAQSFKTIERQRAAKLVRQSAEDGPVLASVARREYGLVATLHPAFQVHISPGLFGVGGTRQDRSEEHRSELQSLLRISYAVICLKKKKTTIS